MMDQVSLIKISNLDYLNNSKFLKKKTWHTIKYRRFFKFFKKMISLFFSYYVFLYFKKNNFFFKICLSFCENDSKQKNSINCTSIQFKFFYINMNIIGHLYFLLDESKFKKTNFSSPFYNIIKKKNYLAISTYNNFLKKLFFFKF